METHALLAALVLADGSLPIGRFAHSMGLESLLDADPSLDEAGIVEVVRSVVVCGLGPLDGVAVAGAARATTLAPLLELDAWASARRLAEPAWRASTSQGRQLAALGPTIAGSDLALRYCAAVAAGSADGNLAVVEGALAGSRGVSPQVAVVVSLRGAASAFLAVAVRLGRLSSRRAQAAIRALEPAIAAAADDAVARDPADASSTALELELHALLHRRAEGRQFIS